MIIKLVWATTFAAAMALWAVDDSYAQLDSRNQPEAPIKFLSLVGADIVIELDYGKISDVFVCVNGVTRCRSVGGSGPLRIEKGFGQGASSVTAIYYVNGIAAGQRTAFRVQPSGGKGFWDIFSVLSGGLISLLSVFAVRLFDRREKSEEGDRAKLRRARMLLLEEVRKYGRCEVEGIEYHGDEEVSHAILERIYKTQADCAAIRAKVLLGQMDRSEATEAMKKAVLQLRWPAGAEAADLG